MNRRSLSLGSIGLALTTLVGCGGGKKQDTPKSEVSCEPLSPQTTKWIDSLLVSGHQRTSDYVAVRLDGPHIDIYKTLWMVAAAIDGEPSVWAIDTITADHGTTLSVNKRAQSISTWFHGDEVRYKVMPDDPGVAKVLTCLP